MGVFPKLPELRRSHPQIHYLTERHRELARRVVAGQKPSEAARDMGITTPWVSTCLSSPIMKDHVEQLRERADENAVGVSKRIQNLSVEAMGVFERILRNNVTDKEGKDVVVPLGLQTSVAKDVLDRAGHGAIRRTETKAVHAYLTSDDVDEMRERIKSDDLKMVMEAQFSVVESKG